MTAAHKSWRLDHDPTKRPNGCNGKPGDSGRNRHKRRNEPTCQQCREAANHANRERRRGQPLPRPLHPCGTFAAATRHRNKNERLCIPCQIAEAKYHANLRAKKRAA